MNFSFTGFADEADKTLTGQIETLKRANWNAIELRLIEGANVCDLSDSEWASVRDQLAEAEIQIVGFGGQIGNWARPISSDFQKDLDELERVAPRMREVDCKFLRIMSYPNDPDSPFEREAYRDEVIRRVTILAEMAQNEGIILVHENCSGYGESLEGVKEILEAVPNPALQLVMDTGNSSLHENDIEATWKYYTETYDRTAHIHIKSAKPNPEGGDYITCFPKEDPVQERILRDLVARGYKGWLSIEPHIMAAVHAGKDVENKEKAAQVWIEYAKELEDLVREVGAE